MDTPDITYILTGYLAGDLFHKNRNTHFADTEGKVVCGVRNRFRFDCHTEIRMVSLEQFYTDGTISFKDKDKLNLRRNQKPISAFITCGTCRKMVIKKLKELAKEAPTQ